MSESSGERQFDATPSRLKRARQSGDIPHSSDLCGAIAFGAGVFALAVVLPTIATLLRSAVEDAALQRRSASVLLLLVFVSAIAVPIAASAVAALFAGGLQVGGLRFRIPAVSLNRLNPVDGLRRLISRDALLTATRGAIAITLLAAIVMPFAYRVVAQALRSSQAVALAAVAWNGALGVAFAGATLAVLFGGFDFAVSLARWRKRLRMTLEEFKRDQRENEGDPLLRSRRRSVQRQYSRSAVRRVVEAAFLVVNPTHIAIALEYRPPDIDVPRVLLRASDHAAVRMREEASRAAIPIVEDAPLARALYTSTAIGESIPLELYVAVAAIVATLARRRALT